MGIIYILFVEVVLILCHITSNYIVLCSIYYSFIVNPNCADIIDEPEISSRKESMASSNLSRDDFPIVCITEVTESRPTLDCQSIREDTPIKSKLDSPNSDDSCADSMFSSKESSVILEENNLAG